MSRSSRSPKPHAFPVELVAELDELCVARERAKGTNPGADGALRDQRIEELQTLLLEVPPPVRGSVLAGARLETVIAAGSFATVWRATRIDSGQECAVKVLHLNCAGRGRMLRHFRQGIAALRALSAAGAPPSIVRLFEADDSQLAFSMTLVQGHDLNDIASRGWALEKKMQIFSGVCDAVKFAHGRGTLHRNLRPANILYDERAGGPVLTDFDSSDLVERGTTAVSHWWYAAPEQKQGGGERLLESDVYSLGRLLQYLITERNPEAGAELTVGDETLARIIATCTRDEPAQRYGDVEEIQTEVRRWRAGLGISASRQSLHPPSRIPPQLLPALPLQQSASGPRWGKLIAWCAVLAVLGGAGNYAWEHRLELGWGSTAAPPAPAPDAGPAPAPKKKPRRPAKRPQAAEPSDNGPVIASDAISRLFRDNGAAFERCHANVALPAAELTGRVLTRFRVDADGVISDARLIETNIKASGVAQCVVRAHNGLRLSEKPGAPASAQSRYDIESAPN